MSTDHLPKTDSIHELAKFWDAHDLTDFESELEEVVEPVFERPPAITLHFQPNEADAIHAIAESQGVAESDLIRQWILERLHAT